MKTFPLHSDETGKQHAFEIENAYIFSNDIEKLLKGINGVTDVHLGGTSILSDTDVRVRFKYFGKGYSIIEPFGDNSRYLISPDTPSDSEDEIKIIETIFKDYKPPIWQRVIGDVLTLRPLSWIWK